MGHMTAGALTGLGWAPWRRLDLGLCVRSVAQVEGKLLSRESSAHGQDRGAGGQSHCLGLHDVCSQSTDHSISQLSPKPRDRETGA